MAAQHEQPSGAYDDGLRSPPRVRHISTSGGGSPLHSSAASPAPRSLPSPLAVAWMPDDATKVCLLCRRSFTWMRHRHHCRMCGMVFCAECSSHRVDVPGLGESRVCHPCYDIATTARYTAEQHGRGAGAAGGAGAAAYAHDKGAATSSASLHDHNLTRGYVCDDALLPTTRVVRRIMPIIQWCLANLERAWRWESYPLGGTLVILWLMLWLRTWLFLFLCCWALVALALNRKAYLILSDGFALAGFYVASPDSSRAEVAQVMLDTLPVWRRPAVATMYRVAGRIADWLDSWYIVQQWMFPDLTTVVCTCLAVLSLFPLILSLRSLVTAVMFMSIAGNSHVGRRFVERVGKRVYARTWTHAPSEVPPNLVNPGGSSGQEAGGHRGTASPRSRRRVQSTLARTPRRHVSGSPRAPGHLRRTASYSRDAPTAPRIHRSMSDGGVPDSDVDVRRADDPVARSDAVGSGTLSSGAASSGGVGRDGAGARPGSDAGSGAAHPLDSLQSGDAGVARVGTAGEGSGGSGGGVRRRRHAHRRHRDGGRGSDASRQAVLLEAAALTGSPRR